MAGKGSAGERCPRPPREHSLPSSAPNLGQKGGSVREAPLHYLSQQRRAGVMETERRGQPGPLLGAGGCQGASPQNDETIRRAEGNPRPASARTHRDGDSGRNPRGCPDALLPKNTKPPPEKPQKKQTKPPQTKQTKNKTNKKPITIRKHHHPGKEGSARDPAGAPPPSPAKPAYPQLPTHRRRTEVP